LAISAAPAAIPVNPNNPAIIAITKKTAAQRSMNNPLLRDISRDYASALATAVKKWFWDVPSQVQPREGLSFFGQFIFSESK
jgi:hypothetical protein